MTELRDALRTNPLGWAVIGLFALYYLTPLLAPGEDRVGFAGIAAVTVACLVAALLVRRWQPWLGVILIGAPLLLNGIGVGAAFVLVWTAARHWSPARQIVVLSSVTATRVGGVALAAVAQGWHTAHTVETTVAVIGLVIALLWGWLARSRAKERQSVLAMRQAQRRADEARLEQARIGERERLAREMHDVLAHRLSLVALHSGVLAFRTNLDPATTQEIAGIIHSNAKLSLDELRLVLSDLRGSEVEPPQPLLSDLPVLLAEVRAAGQIVSVTNDVDVDTIAAPVSRHAYRIIQEALTNARKHAVGAPVALALSLLDTPDSSAELQISISNQITGKVEAAAAGVGLGLVSMTERADSVGGTVHARQVGQRFILDVHLPSGGPS